MPAHDLNLDGCISFHVGHSSRHHGEHPGEIDWPSAFLWPVPLIIADREDLLQPFPHFLLQAGIEALLYTLGKVVVVSDRLLLLVSK